MAVRALVWSVLLGTVGAGFPSKTMVWLQFCLKIFTQSFSICSDSLALSMSSSHGSHLLPLGRLFQTLPQPNAFLFLSSCSPTPPSARHKETPPRAW